MADPDAERAASPRSAPPPPTPSPRVQERAAEILAATGADLPSACGGAVAALAEAADPADPPLVSAAGGGCGGGRRVVLTGEAVYQSDGMRPTHLLVRAMGADGDGVVVLVERGDRGVEPWPGEGATTGEVGFRSVRLDGDRVLSGHAG